MKKAVKAIRCNMSRPPVNDASLDPSGRAANAASVMPARQNTHESGNGTTYDPQLTSLRSARDDEMPASRPLIAIRILLLSSLAATAAAAEPEPGFTTVPVAGSVSILRGYDCANIVASAGEDGIVM